MITAASLSKAMSSSANLSLLLRRPAAQAHRRLSVGASIRAQSTTAASAAHHETPTTRTPRERTRFSPWIRPVYIRSMGAYLPNSPVPNEDIERHLGKLQHRMSDQIKDKILSTNGIRLRYYATVDGVPTHLAQDLAAEAIYKTLADATDIGTAMPLDSVDMLATGCTGPDVMVPGFANLLHGRLENSTTSMDCLTSSGVCISGINALKAAAHAITLGEHERALVVGTEVPSHTMLASRLAGAAMSAVEGGEPSSTYSVRQNFSAEFLRYMLSDGSCAALLDTTPHPSKLSYRIEEFYYHSYAHELPPCMMLGVPEAGKPVELGKTWKNLGQRDGAMLLRQDTKLLKKYGTKKAEEAMMHGISLGFLDSVGGNVDWLFPHLSSYVFKNEFVEGSVKMLGISQDRIWTNLPEVGNVGSASPFLLLWGALNGTSPNGPQLKVGDRVLVFIPESGNFSYMYLVVTVCDSSG